MTEEDIKKIKKEAEILRKLNHPNIIQYIGVKSNPAELFVGCRDLEESVHFDGKDGRRHIGTTHQRAQG